ncbi:MAG: glucokinase, partial [Pseudomonadota bacterium]
ALAAPINGPIAQLTNRDWCVDAGALKTHFGVNTIRLANDFAAMARSVPELSTGSFLSLKPGDADPDAPIIVAGPGTGFGMAVLVPEDKGWRVISGEGGHQAFAPQTELEWALAKRLTEIHGFVTVETVTGGAFMDTVHAALCDIHGVPYTQTSPADLLASAASGDKTALALSQIRAETTMTAVMDAVLALGARGGAVIAGGVSERLVDHLKSPQVLDRMTKRGVRSDYVAEIPIRLLVDSDAPLIGAAALQR